MKELGAGGGEAESLGSHAVGGTLWGFSSWSEVRCQSLASAEEKW